ncbi:MAG: hypothetical protein M0T78_00930 [Actinomycetota bacterium]|nr:hypothetical protein [Actinomycetota bacterium]
MTRDQTVRFDYNEPFNSLLSRRIPARIHHELDIKKTAQQEILTGGSYVASSGIAELQGFHTDTLVVLKRLFSNVTPPTLSRALSAYRLLDLTKVCIKRSSRAQQTQAKYLNDL